MFKNMNCLVLFFDTYGFSEMVIDSKNLTGLVKSLLEIWDWIQTEKHFKNTINFLFSDCGYILYPIEDEKNKSIILTNCIKDASHLYDQFIKRKLFIRGAVTYGSVAFTEYLLVGEPVVKAAKLESNLCPGPFIIVPAAEIDKIIASGEFIREYTITLLPLKNENGVMQCHIRFPSDETKYIEEIINRADYFTKNGPYNHGKFWNDTLNFLLANFNQFKNWRRRQNED